MAAAVSLPNPDRFGYLKPKDVARLAEAYRFSEAAHAGQTRQSGDPYISHPLAVAEILVDWHLDGQTLMAALLHDVTEDTSVTNDEIPTPSASRSPSWSTASPSSTASSSRAPRTRRPRTSARCCSPWRAMCASS